MNTDDIFLSCDRYSRLVEALANLKPDPLAGGIENQIKIVLGEVGGIWPTEIYGDVVIARLEETARRYALSNLS